MSEDHLSRRAVLSAVALGLAAPLVSRVVRAQETPAKQLPLHTTGLEHVSAVVPDVAAAGKFYGRLFNPELYKEKDPPLRYYVLLNPGYIALGSRANAAQAFFDHYCALVTDYNPAAMAEELKAAGLAGGRFGIIPDPDTVGLQMLKDPAGLAKTTEPAGRIVEGDSLLKPHGLDAVVLRVADLEKSAQFYRRFFSSESTPPRKGEVWFQVAGTQLGLTSAAAGQSPGVDHIRVKVASFKTREVTRELEKLGAKITRASDRHSLRFTDPLGLGVELKPV